MAYPPSEIITPETLRAVLLDPMAYDWRSHGIGMLRVYIDEGKDWRLNLWHPSLLNDGISTMHTHPWAFESFVIAGVLQNTRFIRRSPDDSLGGHFAPLPGEPNRRLWRHAAVQYWEGLIPCGVHAPKQHDDGPLIEGDPVKVWLDSERSELYSHGAQYQQAPEEIHDTRATEGTITVMHRTAYEPSGRASVFWPVDQPWGDASRPTTVEDIQVTCAAALEALNKTPWKD